MKKSLTAYLATGTVIAATLLTTSCSSNTEAYSSAHRRTPRNGPEMMAMIETRENTPQRNRSGIEAITNYTSTSSSRETARYAPTSRQRKNPVNQGTILPPNMYGEIGEAVTSKYNGIKKARCAGYAYAVANGIYGKDLTPTDAWNASYHNKVISKTKNAEHVRKLILNRTLTPGMLLALHYPESTYNNEIDEKGNKARYTHLTTFSGTNKKGEAVFLQNLYGREEKISLKNLMKKFRPIEIIDER